LAKPRKGTIAKTYGALLGEYTNAHTQHKHTLERTRAPATDALSESHSLSAILIDASAPGIAHSTNRRAIIMKSPALIPNCSNT
jgi:hypothetical protein